ncbi:MAG TPA: ATP-binding cassette domain-containing protein [Thermomicrobiales bacterium]|nr:ATP-binding cassette domain-containing protein [Thermomicrobiales bacterium]
MSRTTDIAFESVSYRYPNAERAVLRDFDWEIGESEQVLLAGESGSGKSTILRCLNGLVPHFSGGEFGGRVLVRGEDTRLLPTRALARHVGFVFQDPEAHSVSTTVEDEIAFGMEQLGVPVPAMRRRVEEALDLTGTERIRKRSIGTLSGGERQRVAIAAALALQPRILALDEPTSQLDPAGAEDVLDAVRRLNEELGITVVLAEQRLERVVGFTDRMRLLRPGWFDLDDHPREVLRECDPRLDPPVAFLGRIEGWDPLPLTVKDARRTVARLGFEPAVSPVDPPRPDRAPAVVLDRVTIGYGKTPVLEAVSFDVRPGELVAIMGRNGTGKSTLLRALMGLHTIAGGAARIAELNPAIDRTQAIGKKAGFLPQRAASLLFHETVEADVAAALASRDMDRSRLDALLGRFALEHLRERYPLDLSAGEQERAALAVALAGDPEVLLLDEPTRGMDALRKKELAELFLELRERGVAVLMATHDVELVARVATRVVLLGDGGVVAQGGTREVLAGSLTFGTQMNRVFGNGWLTVDDVVRVPLPDWDNARVEMRRSGME